MRKPHEILYYKNNSFVWSLYHELFWCVIKLESPKGALTNVCFYDTFPGQINSAFKWKTALLSLSKSFAHYRVAVRNIWDIIITLPHSPSKVNVNITLIKLFVITLVDVSTINGSVLYLPLLLWDRHAKNGMDLIFHKQHKVLNKYCKSVFICLQ